MKGRKHVDVPFVHINCARMLNSVERWSCASAALVECAGIGEAAGRAAEVVVDDVGVVQGVERAVVLQQRARIGPAAGADVQSAAAEVGNAVVDQGPAVLLPLPKVLESSYSS